MTDQQLPLFDIAEQPAEPNNDGLYAHLAALRERNRAAVEQLAAAGVGPDPRNVLVVRLESLIDTLLADPADRARFEVLFESKMREVLTACQNQLSRSQLLAPAQNVPPPVGLFIPAH